MFSARSTLTILVLVLTAACEAGEQTGEERVEEEPIADAGEDAAAGPPQRVVVQAASYAYQPAEITVAPGSVWFVVTNAADIEHGFEVEGHGMEEAIETIAPGATDSLRVELEESGEYTIYCPVGDHRERGMTGVLTVAPRG